MTIRLKAIVESLYGQLIDRRSDEDPVVLVMAINEATSTGEES